MRQSPPPLNAMRSFEAAARLGSFRRAAEELHVTAAAISQGVKSLERYLGIPLFRREARCVELTEAAMRLLPSVQDGFAAITRGVTCCIGQQTSQVAVAAPPALAAKWLTPRVQRFIANHPEADLRIVAGTEISPLKGMAINPVDGEVDMAIRFGRGHYPHCRVEELFPVTLVPLCSPSLLKQHGLATAADLRHHTLLHNDANSYGDWRPSWAYWLAQNGLHDIDASRGLHFNNTLMTIEAAVNGVGVALSIPAITQDLIATGRLVRPFSQEVGTPFSYALVTPERGLQSATAVALRDWLLCQGADLQVGP